VKISLKILIGEKINKKLKKIKNMEEKQVE
jgi:hypothetical protein